MAGDEVAEGGVEVGRRVEVRTRPARAAWGGDGRLRLLEAARDYTGTAHRVRGEVRTVAARGERAPVAWVVEVRSRRWGAGKVAYVARMRGAGNGSVRYSRPYASEREARRHCEVWARRRFRVVVVDAPVEGVEVGDGRGAK